MLSITGLLNLMLLVILPGKKLLEVQEMTGQSVLVKLQMAVILQEGILVPEFQETKMKQVWEVMIFGLLNWMR